MATDVNHESPETHEKKCYNGMSTFLFSFFKALFEKRNTSSKINSAKLIIQEL